MSKFTALPAVLICAAIALIAASVGARASIAPAASTHHHHLGTAGVSDPDPADCPFCGGNPQVHVRALWAVQKEVARMYVMRLL